jgi:hypothetical protein
MAQTAQRRPKPLQRAYKARSEANCFQIDKIFWETKQG